MFDPEEDIDGESSPVAGASEKWTLEQSPPGARLDVLLHQKYPGKSRATLQRLISGEHILLNGKPVKASHHPAAGDEISIEWPEARPSEVRPEAIPIEVIYEDDFIVVINKAPGMVVHPAAGNEEHTLVNALLHHCAGRLSGVGGVVRPGIVHRLDKDTSGCMVVAKTDNAHLALATQFAGRKLVKIYDAILCGELPSATGEIDAPISRHPGLRKQMTVVKAGGRPARTSYQIVERLRGATLVEAHLHTGRTHQIRVHFQHLGFPLVGDLVYGKRQNGRLKEITGFAAGRQMLHSRLLEFTHPASREVMTFRAALPDDFRKTLRALKKQAL